MILLRFRHLLGIALSLLVAFFLLRLAFLAWNWQLFSPESPRDLFFAFIHALRFDASLLALLLSPLLLGNFLPISQHPRWLMGEKLWLFICAVLCVTPNFTDIEHFHFIKRRATIEMFLNPRDFSALALPLLSQYWYLALLWLALCITLGIILLRITKISRITLLRPRRFAALCIISLGLLVLTVRGGWQRRPLNAAHAITMAPSPLLAALSLNSAYTLLRSISNSTIDEVNFFPADEDVHGYLHSHQQFPIRSKRHDNVVIIIMESMGAEFLSAANQGESRIPFVESLGRDAGLLFVNCIANGGETGFAHNSILASIPQMLPNSIIGTVYENNEIIGLGGILKKYHYATSFFHGGPRGLFNFDIRANTLGFSEQYYQEDYPDQNDFDGEWGIYDEPFLGFAAEQLAHTPTPFASYILTLSNHPPHSLPASYQKPDKPHWTTQEHTAYYADQGVAKFFARIAQEPWFNDTLFVITGDHVPFHIAEKMRAHPIDRRRIPLVFYHPRGLPQKGISLRLTQQTDILPSVLDFLGLARQEHTGISPFGQSVFATGPGLALVYNFGSYNLYAGSTLFTLKGDNSLVQENLGPSLFPLPPDNSAALDYPRLLKSFVQYYSMALIKNRFYPQRHSS